MPVALASVAAAERTRVEEKARGGLPPLLAPWADAQGLTAGLAAFRQAPLADEGLIAAVGQLSRAQLLALRAFLLTRPPHPRLASVARHPAVSGPPTPEGLVEILTGRVFDAPAPARQRAARSSAPKTRGAPTSEDSPEARAARQDRAIEQLVRSGLSRDDARFAVLVPRLFPLMGGRDAGAERATLLRLIQVRPETAAELDHFAETATPESVRSLLDDLRPERRWVYPLANPLVASALEGGGLERAVELGRGLRTRGDAVRAWLTEIGEDAARSRAREGAPADVLAELDAANARWEQHQVGASVVMLRLGATWTPMEVPRTSATAAREAQLLAPLGLPGDALADAEALAPTDRARVARALRDDLARRRPELAAELERELLGRRFVPHELYQPLRDRGAANPEHRWTAETFESWRAAAAWVAETAAASRHRALQPGELIEVFREAHRRASEGILAVGESHLQRAQLGVFRTKDDEAVAATSKVTRAELETLQGHPELSRVETAGPPLDGQFYVRITFARGSQVESLMSELDAWVRANEGSLPPHELGAELHRRLIAIHAPFDGTGRTAKLMVDFLLERAGVLSPVFLERNVLAQGARWSSAVAEASAHHARIVERTWRASVSG